MLHLIKRIIKEQLDEALRDELPDYMINAVKTNNPTMGYRYLDMDVPKHTELIPNVKIEINEPQIINNFIKDIQFSFSASIIKQFEHSKLVEILNLSGKVIPLLEKAFSKHMDFLYKQELQHIYSNMDSSKEAYLKSIIKELTLFYSKEFPLLQGKDNNLTKPIFSNNKSNIFTFIKSFNTAFPQDAVDLNAIMNDRIFQGLREPIMNFDKNVNDLAKTKLYLYITDKPADILRMSVSNFYSSCQNLYTGNKNEQLLANVFDENSKIAYLIFDSSYIDNQGNKHPFTPIARTIIRVGEKNKIMFDVTYPSTMEQYFYKIIEKYTNLKNQGQARSVYPYKNIGLPAPYMDKYSIKSTFTYDKDEINIRRELLSNYLKVNPNYIEMIGDTHFEYNGHEYLVYTEEEADEYAMDKLRTEWYEYLNSETSFYNLINLKVFNIEPIYKLFRINDASLKKNNLTLQKFLAKLNINTLQDFENYLMNKTPIEDSQDKYQQFQTRLDFKKEFLTREDVYNIDKVVDLFGYIKDVRKATLSADGQEHFVEQGTMIIYKYI
jgi:hypothetical protein